MRIYEKVSNYIKNNKLSSENIAKQSGIEGVTAAYYGIKLSDLLTNNEIQKENNNEAEEDI